MLPPVAIKIGHKAAKLKQKVSNQITTITGDITRHVHTALNAHVLNNGGIEELKIKKTKFLKKTEEIIEYISAVIHVAMIDESITDTILSDTISIKTLSYDDIKSPTCLKDYDFIYETIKTVIMNNTFPTRDEYIKLNTLYKKYKKLFRGSAIQNAMISGGN
jgi:hypothetical protein